MTKIKDNESPEDKQTRILINNVANVALRSEKMAWKRKQNKMLKVIDKLKPIEEKLLLIIRDEKQPYLDQITKIRKELVDDCVHPVEHLIPISEGCVECKFCQKRIKLK